MKIFIAPIIASALVLMAAAVWGGGAAFVLVAALAALEISLSFDNAVINAQVLGRMERHWQQRFLTWGMLSSVVLVRFILPVLIIAAAAFASPISVAVLAFTDPSKYAQLLAAANPIIHAFGGAFLLMVALKYFFDEEKQVHWLKWLERPAARVGATFALETLIAGAGVLCASVVLGSEAVFFAGAIGIALYLLMEHVTESWAAKMSGAAKGGVALFVYLNILDAAFSLDGVVGAFALTTQILVILAGLGLGAYFVRAITIYLTHKKTLAEFIYLEHGAHWAIFSLALCLFAALFVHVPEVIPGGIGLLFAALSFASSWRVRSR